MLKYITTKDIKYNGLLYKGRKVIADEKYLERLVKCPEAIVYSSWRSLAEQKVLVEQGKSQTLYSNHRRGMACDVINWKEVQDKMRSLGLINDISWDKNHFAYDGESKASKYPIYDTLPKILEEFKPNVTIVTHNFDPGTPEIQTTTLDTTKTVKPLETQNLPSQRIPDKQDYLDKQTSQLVEDVGNLIILTLKKLYAAIKSLFSK